MKLDIYTKHKNRGLHMKVGVIGLTEHIRTHQAKTLSGPVDVRERKLTPDLTRGFMLLFIALANAHLFLYDVSEYTLIDPITVLVKKLLIDDRARPLFAFLFAYGMVQLMRRQEDQGTSDWISIRKLIHRRGWSMILIGVLHVVLLAPIEIIAIYGLLCLFIVGMLRVRDRTLLWGTGISFAFLTTISVLIGLDHPQRYSWSYFSKCPKISLL
jgi:uncharacterized protein